MAAVALGAMAMVGSTAVAQAAALPPAGTITYAFTSATASPLDIQMNWRGTCTHPGQVIELVVEGTNWGGSDRHVRCEYDGTYWASFVVTYYEDRGLRRGQSFDYQALLVGMEEPRTASTSTGTATL
jgi:uncharacterized protein Veg